MKPIEIVPPSKEFTAIMLECVKALRDYEPAKPEILKTLQFMNSPVFLVDKKVGIDTKNLQYRPGLIVEHETPERWLWPKELKEMYKQIQPALMVATSTKEKKKKWREAMGLTDPEQTNLIQMFNLIDDIEKMEPKEETDADSRSD